MPNRESALGMKETDALAFGTGEGELAVEIRNAKLAEVVDRMSEQQINQTVAHLQEIQRQVAGRGK